MQAVVITAYKSFEQLQELAELLSEKFLVYIHIDRRVPKDKYEALKSGGIRVYSLYPVNWGGSNHLKAILYLMHEALKEHPDLDYIHIISDKIGRRDRLKKFIISLMAIWISICVPKVWKINL